MFFKYYITYFKSNKAFIIIMGKDLFFVKKVAIYLDKNIKLEDFPYGSQKAFILKHKQHQ